MAKTIAFPIYLPGLFELETEDTVEHIKITEIALTVSLYHKDGTVTTEQVQVENPYE